MKSKYLLQTLAIKEAASQELKKQVCTTEMACRSDVFIRQNRSSTASLFPFRMVLGSSGLKQARKILVTSSMLSPGDREQRGYLILELDILTWPFSVSKEVLHEFRDTQHRTSKLLNWILRHLPSA